MTALQNLSFNALSALMWAITATLIEWLIIGRPYTVGTELARLGLHALVGLSLSATLTGLTRSAQRLRARPRLSALALSPWLLFSGWGLWLGERLSQGDWVQAQPWAPWLSYATGLCFAFGGLCLGLISRAPRSALTLTLLSLGVCTLSGLDLSALRGLYPELHLTFYLLSALCALLLAQAPTLRLALTPKSHQACALSVASLCILIGCYAQLQLTGAPYERSSLAQASPRAALFPVWRRSEAGLDDLDQGLAQLSSLNREALNAERDARRHAQALTLKGDRKHVILIVVDTLRYDALYHPPLTPERADGRAPLATAEELPFLTQWRAQDAHVFLNAYTQAGRTKLSTPALFTSGEVSLKGRSGGLHLAERLSRAGYQPLALTPEYFLWPVPNGASHLLESFEHSWHYTEDKQHHALQLWGSLLDHHEEERPLFAWVHLYMMHAPYFAGTKRLSVRDGSAVERYRMALKTLDHQLSELCAELERRGMLSNSVIALTSDHGEGLGDHGTDGHGVGVFEEQSRTPLLIYDERLKTATQRLHREVVGNVDLTPTLSALAGLPVHEGDEGQSLLPLLMRGDSRPSWPYHYLLSNGNGSERGLVTQGRVKLTYSPRRDELSLYDLERDPHEHTSLAGRDEALRTELTSALSARLPTLALTSALKRRDPARWTEERDRAVANAARVISEEEQLSVALQRRLLRVATQLSAPQLLQSLADRAQDDKTRAWIGVEALKVTPPLAERLLKEALSSAPDLNSLEGALWALSAYQPKAFGVGWLSELLSARDPELRSVELWRAWLTLTQSWPHQGKDSARYQTLLKQALTDPTRSPWTRALLLRFSGARSEPFLREHPALISSLNALIQATLIDRIPSSLSVIKSTKDPQRTPDDQPPEINLTRASLALSGTLARLLSPERRAELRARCLTLLQTDQRAQLKKSAVEALRALAISASERSEVTQVLIKRSSDRLILVPIINTLSRLPSKQTIAFLKRMKRSARTGYARVSAKKALEQLQKKRRARPKVKARAKTPANTEPKRPAKVKRTTNPKGPK